MGRVAIEDMGGGRFCARGLSTRRGYPIVKQIREDAIVGELGMVDMVSTRKICK